MPFFDVQMCVDRVWTDMGIALDCDRHDECAWTTKYYAVGRNKQAIDATRDSTD